MSMMPSWNDAIRSGYTAGFNGRTFASVAFDINDPFADRDYAEGVKIGANEAFWGAVRSNLATDIETRCSGLFVKNRCPHCSSVYASLRGHVCAAKEAA